MKIDLNMPIGTDFKEGLTPEEEDMIVINNNHLEISPDVSDVTVRTAR